MLHINFIAVLIAAVVPMVMGFIWYNPKVFGTIWMKETVLTQEEIQKGLAFFAEGLKG